MKHLILGSFILLSSSLYALEVTQTQRLEQLNPVELSGQINTLLAPENSCSQLMQQEETLYERYPDEIYRIREILFNDDTNTIPYQLGHFSCHNYAKRLYLQHSSKVQSLAPLNIPDIEREWNTTIKRDENALLDMTVITLSSPEDGYFHAINAVLLDKDHPEDMNSYIYIEPQSDKLLLASELRAHGSRLMHRTLSAPIKVESGTFNEFKFNGNIWQSFSSTDHTFIDD